MPSKTEEYLALALRAIIKRLTAIFMLKTGRRQQCLAKPKNILLLPSARQTA